MSTRGWVAGVLVAVAGMWAAGGRAGTALARPAVQPLEGQPASAASASSALELSPKEFDFGEIWQGEPARGEILLRNVGDAPLSVEVKTSCGCAAPTKPRSPLLPGESDTLTITYDTLKRQGPANQVVTLTTNDPKQPKVEIPVRGMVKALYTVSPGSGLGFHRLHTDARETQKLVFENKYDAPLHLKLKEGQDLKFFEVAINELEPGQKFELVATTRPPLPPGFNNVDVIVETGVKPAPEIRIPLNGYVRPDVEVAPGVLPLSKHAAFPIPKDVVLRYREDRPIKIVEVRPSAPSIKVEIQPPGPAQAGWVEQLLKITVPPFKDLPPGEAGVEILTDAREPEYQKLQIRIQVVEPRPATQPVGPSEVPPHP